MQINKTHHSCACQDPFGSMALSSGSNPGGKISQLTVGKKKSYLHSHAPQKFSTCTFLKRKTILKTGIHAEIFKTSWKKA